MSFPQELAALPQWICWRLEPDSKGDKPRKVPYDPKTGRKASSTNPQTWATLPEAEAARDKYTFTGLGFVFTEERGIVGVDIDHCREANGTLNDTARAILEKYPSYTEISPSGTGLHIFYHGAMPGKGNKNSSTGVEMYSTGRYFTMTGQRLDGTPDGGRLPEDIADGTAALPWIHEAFLAKKRKPRAAKTTCKTVRLADEQVLEKARAASGGDDFTDLWEGRWKDKYGSQSEADLGLCCALAFWTGKDAEQMDRLFRQSALLREKWDTVHHADGSTYGAETIRQAIARTEQTYSPEGEPVIIEQNGRYYRVKGEQVYPITNFIVRPLEMLIAEDETQMTCDLVTMYGETFRQTFMTTDFGNLQKFKGVLNKRTISLSYTGSEGDLELLKGYLAGLEWQVKYGVKALGLHERDGRWVFVSKGGAFAAGGEAVEDMVQLEKHASIETVLPDASAIAPARSAELAPLLLGYNEPAKTVTALAWCAGCFAKEHLRKAGIKYPHLFLIGEAGSGKSNTLERVILPIFGRSKVVAAPQVTAFTLMKDAASSNIFPQALDEFKPSKIDRYRLDALHNHMRDSYDGHAGVRGRADQTQIFYDLLAPVVIAGEESADETAVRERGMELLFSKRDLKGVSCRASFQQLTAMQGDLPALGRAIMDTVLTLSTEAVRQWHDEALALFNAALPSRVVNNLACCMVGIRLLEALCARLSFAWGQVFPLGVDACVKHMEYAVREYLLDGGDANKSVIEQTLEVIDRMGLSDTECRPMENDQIAIHFKAIYDRYTQYRRDHAILGESLPYSQFIKQLRKSDLFIENKTVRFNDAPKKATVLNYALMRQRCDVDGFLGAQIEPLRGSGCNL
jgi:putative DNA primase/helicase